MERTTNRRSASRRVAKKPVKRNTTEVVVPPYVLNPAPVVEPVSTPVTPHLLVEERRVLTFDEVIEIGETRIQQTEQETTPMWLRACKWIRKYPMGLAVAGPVGVAAYGIVAVAAAVAETMRGQYAVGQDRQLLALANSGRVKDIDFDGLTPDQLELVDKVRVLTAVALELPPPGHQASVQFPATYRVARDAAVAYYKKRGLSEEVASLKAATIQHHVSHLSRLVLRDQRDAINLSETWLGWENWGRRAPGSY